MLHIKYEKASVDMAAQVDHLTAFNRWEPWFEIPEAPCCLSTLFVQSRPTSSFNILAFYADLLLMHCI